MENLAQLSAAVEKSTIGASGIASITIGTEIQLYGVKIDDRRSEEGKEPVYSVTYNVVNSKRTFTTGTDGYAALRCINIDGATADVTNSVNALKALKDEVDPAKALWTVNLAEHGVEFWKSIIDAQADVNASPDAIDAADKTIHEKVKFTCIAKATTIQASPVVDRSSTEEVEKKWAEYCDDTNNEVPSFLPRCYSGFAAYTKALNARADFMETRNALLETALLPKYKKLLCAAGGLKACRDKNLLQQTPVFTVTL